MGIFHDMGQPTLESRDKPQLGAGRHSCLLHLRRKRAVLMKHSLRVQALALLGLLTLCTSCADTWPPYQINGDFNSATAYRDPDVEAMVSKVIADQTIKLQLSPSIKNKQEQIPLFMGTRGQAAPVHFYFTPASALQNTVESMNAQSTCVDLQRSRCVVIKLSITDVSALSDLWSDEGVWNTSIRLEVSASVAINAARTSKTCWVRAIGTRVFSFFATYHNLSRGFQHATREAFTKAVICLITPDSTYNDAALQAYFS